jgi:serine protease Do
MSKWSQVLKRRIAQISWGLVLLFPLATANLSDSALAADMTATSTAATELAASSLNRLLAGATPSGVSDLRVMQDHVRKLSDQVMKYTVGVQVGNAQGSGVIISKDGYVLTAAHVAGATKRPVTFILSDGRLLRGKTLGLNRTLDAGLMKIDAKEDLPFAEMGQIDLLKDGQWCLATGHPGGYQSDRKAVVRLGRVLNIDSSAITTDCTLVGGDSGGPLFDLSGKVIGINSRISGALTANMHVPVGTFKDTWDRLTKGDEWGHYPGDEPYIGVKGEPNVKEAKIAAVMPDSPAAEAKLQAGDIVIRVDDQDVADFESLVRMIGEHQPNDKVEIVVKRGEELLTLNLKVGNKRGFSR